MATQPQKDNLSKLFKGTLADNTSSISDNQISVQESQVIIDDFTPSCKGFDTRIVALASSITTIQSQIATLYSSANAVGCGTTAGATTIYPDTIKSKSYNVCISSYDGENPFDISSATLTSSNVGFGTYTLYTQNDSSASGLGTAYANVGTCYGVGCITGNCTTYSNSITTKQTELISLRAELTSLSDSVNSLKFLRNDYETQRWSSNYSIRTLTEENIGINTALSVLNDPSYDYLI